MAYHFTFNNIIIASQKIKQKLFNERLGRCGDISSLDDCLPDLHSLIKFKTHARLVCVIGPVCWMGPVYVTYPVLLV